MSNFQSARLYNQKNLIQKKCSRQCKFQAEEEEEDEEEDVSLSMDGANRY